MPRGKGEVVVKILGDTKSLNRSLTVAQTRLGRFGTKARAAGRAMAVGIGIGVAAVAAAGFAAFKLGETFDKAYDTIRVGTGATGKKLEALEQNFKNVVRAVPASFGDASQAIADLNTRLGLTGKPLEDVTERILELTRLTHTDLSTNIPAVTRLFGDWSVATDQQANTLDKLFRASQSTGIGVDKLSSLMVQFGSPLRQLGFDFDTAAAMFSRFEKEGVNIETAMPGLRFALKTFAQAGEEPAAALKKSIAEIKAAGTAAEANQKAFEVFGVRAGPDLAAAIREGRFELDDYIDAIVNGDDTILKAGKATESFGEKWTKLKNRVLVGLEPVARKVFDAMGTGLDLLETKGGPALKKLQLGFSALAAAFSGEGVTSDGFVGVMERIGVAARAVVDWFKRNWPAIKQTIVDTFTNAKAVWDAVWPAIVEGFNTIVEIVQTNWPAIRDTIKNVMTVVSRIIRVYLAVIRAVWERFGDVILDRIISVFNLIKSVIQGALQIVHGIIEVITGLITGDWGKAWDGIKDIFGGVWRLITAIVKAALEVIRDYIRIAWRVVKELFVRAWQAIVAVVKGGVNGVIAVIRGIKNLVTGIVRGAFNAVKDNAKSAIDGAVSFFTGLPGRIRDALGSIGSAAKDVGAKIVAGLGRGLSGVINFVGDIAAAVKRAIVGAINTVIDLLNHGIPDKLGWGPASINLPDNPIPHISLARGGVATRPTAAIVGDAGLGNPEVVAPEKMLRAIFREEARVQGGGIRIDKIEMNQQASVGELTRRLRWLQLTGGVRGSR